MSNEEVPYNTTEFKLIATADLCRELRIKLSDDWVVELDNLVPSLIYARIGIKRNNRQYGFDFYLRYYFDNQMYRIGGGKTNTNLASQNIDDIIEFIKQFPLN